MNRPHKAFVSLGSNMGDCEANLDCAREALSSIPGVCLKAVSPVYLTEPQNVREQPWFANQVIRLACTDTITPHFLLDLLLAIEKNMGRRRGESKEGELRYGPRIIDLDLLLFDEVHLNTPRLILPHPRLFERAFVLVPLCDIEPDLCLPGGSTPAKALLSLNYAVEGNRIRQ